MAQASVTVSSLDPLFRERDRVNALLDGGAKVVARSAGTLRRRWQPFARRDMQKDFALSARAINQQLRVYGNETGATLSAKGRRITLNGFVCRQTATGVSVQIRTSGFVEIPHAFIRTATGAAAAAGPQVFIRTNAPYDVPSDVEDVATIAHDRHGYPILLLAGPSVAGMLREGDREERMIVFGQELFAAEVDRLLEANRNG